ncbi:hypothetical protein KASHIRA_00310 [Serratia phage vB_SmaM-Kashira]|nr:hypothetical protein KASHIRA_00310 [Serratia phage vB_SmaM-Kashira]
MNEGLRDLFEEAVMEKINISKKTLVGMRTNLGYRNSTISGIDYNLMWEMWLSGHMAAWREVDALVKRGKGQ